MERYYALVLWAIILFIAWYWGRFKAAFVIRPLYYFYLGRFKSNRVYYKEIYDEFKQLTPYLWKRGVSKDVKADIYLVVTSYLVFMREFNKVSK